MMVAVRVQGVHISWQYTKLDVIRQALMNEDAKGALLDILGKSFLPYTGPGQCRGRSQRKKSFKSLFSKISVAKPRL